jgi:hypothetical protein
MYIASRAKPDEPLAAEVIAGVIIVIPADDEKRSDA